MAIPTNRHITRLLRSNATSGHLPTHIILIIDEFRPLLIILLLQLCDMFLLLLILALDLLVHASTQLLQFFTFAGELGTHDGGDAEDHFAFGFDIVANSENCGDNEFEVVVVGAEYGGWGHNQVLHSLQQVQVEILIPTRDKSHNLILVHIKGDPLTRS